MELLLEGLDEKAHHRLHESQRTFDAVCISHRSKRASFIFPEERLCTGPSEGLQDNRGHRTGV